MNADKIIDWLNAIQAQLEGNVVELDGETMFVEQICELAIDKLYEQI